MKTQLTKEQKKSIQLLRKLAKHLRLARTRGLDKFNFGYVFAESDCGTSGCAIGELPFAFPKAKLKMNEMGIGFAKKFFRLGPSQAYHLFMRECQDLRFGKRRLKRTATAREVSANIREFCDRVKAGKCKLID